MTAWAESYVAIPAHLAITNEQYFDVFRDLAEAALDNKPDGERPWDLEIKARWITPAAAVTTHGNAETLNGEGRKDQSRRRRKTALAKQDRLAVLDGLT